MLSRALDANNDIFPRQGAIALVSDGAEVVQHVRSRLLFYMEECAWDQTAGVPYFQRIFVKPADLAQTESLLKTEIIKTPGVATLIDFAMKFDSGTRKLTVTWKAETTYGTVVGATININMKVA